MAMFKKILQSLSKSHAAKPAAFTPAPPSTPAPKPLAPVAKPGAVLEKIAKVPAPAMAPAPAARSPEELCEISPKMPKDQIQARLKMLYRRYNRSASSLDAKIRSEADTMLDAIVRVREKHFGEI